MTGKRGEPQTGYSGPHCEALCSVRQPTTGAHEDPPDSTNKSQPPLSCFSVSRSAVDRYFSGSLAFVNPRDERLDTAGPDLGDIRLSPLEDLAVIKPATPQELPRRIGEKMSPLDLREFRADLLNPNVVWMIRNRTTCHRHPSDPCTQDTRHHPIPSRSNTHRYRCSTRPCRHLCVSDSAGYGRSGLIARVREPPSRGPYLFPSFGEMMKSEGREE